MRVLNSCGNVTLYDGLMKLPNANQAIIPIEKLRDYCLNPSHSGGKHKAVVFAKVLGLSSKDAEWFKEVLKNKILETEAIESKEDKYGKRYIVEFDLAVGQKRAKIRSTWIILARKTKPKLTSCYILKKRKG